MSILSMAVGGLSLIVTVAPWALTGPRLRRRLAPELTGLEAILAAVIFAMSGLLLVTMVVGVLGEFKRWPIAVSSLAVALVAAALARRGTAIAPGGPDVATAHDRAPLWITVVAAIAVAICGLQLLAGIAHSFGGVTDYDSIGYHLVHPAKWVQLGSLDHLQQVANGDNNAYQPSNFELFHGIGMLDLRNDFASLFIDALAVGLLFAAAALVGRRLATAATGMLAAAVVVAAMPLGATAGGTGLTDLPTIACLVVAVAFLLPAAGSPPTALPARGSQLTAGLAAGLAVGGKLTCLAIVLLLLLVVPVLALRSASSRRDALVFPAATFLTGSFWYLRNLVLAGNPLPGLSVLKTLGFPTPVLPLDEANKQTVLSYIGNAHVLRHVYPSALNLDFGPLWPLLLLAALIGGLLALIRGSTVTHRVLGGVALIGLGAYLVTPTSAGGAPGTAALFAINVRYAAPALQLGVLALIGVGSMRARTTIVPMILVIVFVAEVARGAAWPGNLPALAIVMALGVTLAAVTITLSPRFRVRQLHAALAMLVVVALLWIPLQRHYLAKRYAVTGNPQADLYRVAQQIHDGRIAAAGTPLTYPFYGVSFDNQVQYLGRPAAHHAYLEITSCRAWLAALHAGNYGYVVTQDLGLSAEPPQLAWTLRNAANHAVFRNSDGVIVKVNSTTPPVDCT